MTEPIQNRTRNRFQNREGTRSGTMDQTQTQIQTVLTVSCGVSGSNPIHLTATYGPRRSWMDAAPRLLGGGC